MPSASKIKGSGYEREVAAWLTQHYGQTFIRNVSGSGAYIGGSNRARRAHLTEEQIRQVQGDIVPPQSFGLLNCEAKFYAELAWHQLFSQCSLLDSWLAQLMAASGPRDLNVLFFKINRRGSYVAVQALDAWDCSCNHMIYTSPQLGQWMVYSLENFFQLNSQTFQNLSRPDNLTRIDSSASETVQSQNSNTVDQAKLIIN